MYLGTTPNHRNLNFWDRDSQLFYLRFVSNRKHQSKKKHRDLGMLPLHRKQSRVLNTELGSKKTARKGGETKFLNRLGQSTEILF